MWFCCFVQTMAGLFQFALSWSAMRTISSSELQAGHQSSSVVLEYSRFCCWKETYLQLQCVRWTVRVCFISRDLGEWHGERLWSVRAVRGGPSFCVRGCRQPLHHHSSFLFPPRHSPQPWRGLQLSDGKKVKVIGKQQNPINPLFWISEPETNSESQSDAGTPHEKLRPNHKDLWYLTRAVP